MYVSLGLAGPAFEARCYVSAGALKVHIIGVDAARELTLYLDPEELEDMLDQIELARQLAQTAPADAAEHGHGATKS